MTAPDATDASPTSAAERLAGAAAAVLIAYFFGQIVVYCSVTRFYGQGITYLINFTEIGLAGYVEAYLLHSSYYPPFYYAVLFFGRLLGGYDYLPYVLVSSAFTAAGAVYVFALLRRASGPGWAAFGVAAFLLAPGTTLFSKSLIIEAPLMGLVPAAFYHLYASRGFRSRGHSIAAGVIAGVGLLTKWTFVVYAGPAYLIALLAAFAGESGRFQAASKRQWVHVASVAVAAALVAGWWYGFAFDFDTFRASAANDPRFAEYDYARHVAYTWSLAKIILGKVWVWAAVAGLAFFTLLSRHPLRLAGAAVLLLGVPFFLFAVPVHMEDRYLYPLVPAVSVLLAWAGATARWRIPRVAAAIVLLGVLLFNHAVVLVPRDTDKYRDDDPVIHRWGALFWGKAGTPEILSYIDGMTAKWGLRRDLIIAPHPLWTNYHCNFVYMVYFLALRPDMAEHFMVTRFTKFRYAEFSRELPKFDFLVADEQMMNRYMGRLGEGVEEYLTSFSKQGYIDQNYGIRFEAFALDDIQKDYLRIHEHFRVAKVFEFEDAYRVLVFVNKRFDDLASARENEDAPAYIGLDD